MKVLLINQNPVIKKLVGISGKKLNLEVENVARIAPDFNVKNYICIIVDDDSVGKNLDRLTALQDKVKVCLLFSRNTQIKNHEFNIAIQKPFLPTDILEILNDCIPKDGEAKSQDEDDIDDSLLEYDDIHNVNEIDMDLKSAEITPPDGINIDSVKLQEEAEKIANEDTDSMLDFDPDSLDFSSLEEAGEVIPEAQKNSEELKAVDNGNDDSQINTKAKEASESNEIPANRVGSIFDSDLSDLKPSNDDPLDLENFDLDSIVDASALKAASLGIPSKIEDEAKEVVNNLDDEDDLFLSDDERDLLQPSPKKFMQAKKEEEEKRVKELEEAEQNLDNIESTIEPENIENTSSENINTDIAEALEGDELQPNTKDIEQIDINTNDTKRDILDDNTIEDIDLESLTNTDNISKATLQTDKKEDNKTQSIDSIDIDNKSETLDFEALDKEQLDNIDLKNNITDKSTKENKLNKEDIDSVDLSSLDETLETQKSQKDKEIGTLDDAFDDLTAALNSAFENISIEELNGSKQGDSKEQEIDSKDDVNNIDLESAENIQSKSKIDNDISLENLETIDIESNEANEIETKKDLDEKELNLDSLENMDFKENLENNLDLDDLAESKIDNNFNIDDTEHVETTEQKEDSNLDDLLNKSLQNDILQEENNEEMIAKDTKELESLKSIDDLDSILSSIDDTELKDNIKEKLQDEEAKEEIDSKDDINNIDLESAENIQSKSKIDNDISLENLETIDIESNEANEIETIKDLDEKELSNLDNTQSLSEDLLELDLKDEAENTKEQLGDELTLNENLDENTEDITYGIQSDSATQNDSNIQRDSDNIDLDSLLDTSDLMEDSTQDIKHSVIPQETIAEVNEALLAISDDMLDGNNTESTSSNSEINETAKSINTSLDNSDSNEELLARLLDNSINEQLDSKTITDDIAKEDLINTQDLIDSEIESKQDLSELDLQPEDINQQLDSTESSKSMLQDSITQKDDIGTQPKETKQDLDSKKLHATLPSNEDSIEKLTETELAKALGEIELPIMDLEQLTETQNITQETKSIDDNTAQPSLNDTTGLAEIANDNTSQINIKELDANSIIDLFKNTPADKLHEIFRGQEITFNIRFGKNP